MKANLGIVIATVLLSGCSLFRGRSSASGNHTAAATGYEKSSAAKSSVPGVTPEMATKYGCAWAQVEANWARRRMAPAKPGDALCDVLGRYGQPYSVSARRAADMQLLSLQYRPSGRSLNIVAVRYDDTPMNRKLRRQPATWTVQSYSTPR